MRSAACSPPSSSLQPPACRPYSAGRPGDAADNTKPEQATTADVVTDHRNHELPLQYYLPVRYAERQRDTFPSVQVVILHDSGHWPMIDNPVAVEETVLTFLSALTGP